MTRVDAYLRKPSNNAGLSGEPKPPALGGLALRTPEALLELLMVLTGATLTEPLLFTVSSNTVHTSLLPA